jgi:DNA (cytosine-5)-methyltransferase 1
LWFALIDIENVKIESETSTLSCESATNACVAESNVVNGESSQNNGSEKSEWSLLDLYSGCGAMSTGLCFGASISGIKLVTVSTI